MHGERSLLIGVLWRVAVMLALFNPAASLSQWMLASWQTRPGVVLIVVAVVAMVLLYMLSLAREFLGATIVAWYSPASPRGRSCSARSSATGSCSRTASPPASST